MQVWQTERAVPIQSNAPLGNVKNSPGKIIGWAVENRGNVDLTECLDGALSSLYA
jgi:hypothetical protein